MGMAVDGQVRTPLVDRLRQQIAAQEWIDLERLGAEGRLNRRVVHEGDLDIHSVQRPQRFLELPARRMVCRTNAFISGSPKSVAQAPVNPPPKPFEPAMPTRRSPTSTVSDSPSNTRMPAPSRMRRTSSSRSAW